MEDKSNPLKIRYSCVSLSENEASLSLWVILLEKPAFAWISFFNIHDAALPQTITFTLGCLSKVVFHAWSSASKKPERGEQSQGSSSKNRISFEVESLKRSISFLRTANAFCQDAGCAISLSNVRSNWYLKLANSIHKPPAQPVRI